MVAIAAGVALVATVGRESTSDAIQPGLRLEQPDSPPGGGVPLHMGRVAARVERIRGLELQEPAARSGDERRPSSPRLAAG